jgi:CheY-like chemotaxis protein
VLDLVMPNIDGFEVLARLKELGKDADAPGRGRHRHRSIERPSCKRCDSGPTST